ncbi:MAG: hypothetical protein ACR2QH_18955, partial [Geminicoccaceae bacterium]
MRWVATVYASFKALMIAALAGHSGAAEAQELSADDRAWEAVKASGSPEACQQYLSEFPTGAHAEEAFRCLVEGVVP